MPSKPTTNSARRRQQTTTNGASTPHKSSSKSNGRAKSTADSGNSQDASSTAEDPKPLKKVEIPFFRLRLAIMVGALSYLAYILVTQAPTPTSDEEPTGLQQRLPERYILCSHGDGEKNIYTVNAANERAECILVEGKVVGRVGSLGAIRQHLALKHSDELSSTVRIIRIHPGAIVVPGLADSHCHILEYGASRLIDRLWEGKTVLESVQKVGNYVLSNPDVKADMDKVIEGWGWDHTAWEVEKMPNWRDFETDPRLIGRRIILQSKDGHALWVSKRVLEEDGPFPDGELEGGLIIRDSDGFPTGVFMDSAQELIKRPTPTQEDLETRFGIAVDKALSVGLTSLHDAGFKPDSLAFFRRRAEDPKLGLPIRIYGMSHFDEHGAYWGNTTKPIIAMADGRLNARSVKIFADGALRTGGAALYEPYSDNNATRGMMRIAPQLLADMIPRFLKDGWQTNVHAIGDRANGVVLDAFEEAISGHQVDVASLRPRLEHAQVMTEPDMKRLGRLGVIASVQPTHAISDMWFAEERLGPERVKGLYAFRTIIESGARITLGSDFPVEDINPLSGFHGAITRLSPDTHTSPHGQGGWFPSQRLTRLEALRGMTIDAAYASFSEGSVGSLEVGKRADYTVLSQDIMQVETQQILETSVVATALDGQVAYGVLFT